MEVKKVLALVVIIGLMLVGCNKNNNSDEAVYIRKDISESELESAEMSIVEGMFTIDVNSYPSLAGNADYVLIGKVLEIVSVEYRNPIEMENEDGSTRISTVPYTNYSVQVVENLKGNLNQEEPIIITKHGGLEEDGETLLLFENDCLPTVGNTYVFYVYAQEDGSNLVLGPNSSIPVEESGASISTKSVSKEIREDILEQVRQGVENQIVTDRERFVSNDEVK